MRTRFFTIHPTSLLALLLNAIFAVIPTLGQGLHAPPPGAERPTNMPLQSPGALASPRPLLAIEELGRAPLSNYGSLESVVQAMRAHRPLDLTVQQWRQQHPHAKYDQWAQAARRVLANGLHYDSGPLDLNAITTDRWETDDFVRETIEFNTAPWFRVPGYFYTPKNVPLPAPALVVFHEWGGPMLFGADRVSGESLHPAITQHRQKYTSGRALADWYAAQGYAVIVIDAYHFGRRAPRGLRGLPESYDPSQLDTETLNRYDAIVRQQLYTGVRELNWAGTTWAGVNYGDDSRCIDYLVSRPEVDPKRIGCTGLSGGGWRTNILAALDPRIKAAVSVGWMTTGDTQQAYNLSGAVGTFCLLPGVWDRIDIPDLVCMAAPKAVMVVSGTNDDLFPPLGQRDAAEQISAAYEWAGSKERFRNYAPAKTHCYDAEIQAQALAWFDQYLKATKAPNSNP
ncbi:dienelactone hydrolase family protein [Aureliella helgolandensis]|uniref:Alpha/beta hydrolase family protein n=1 Tax=Aureliella helgolandensis TaxID=2527968 RepID=A0A518GAR8_9BACT|nr:alpha/beta hydrolase family protein [Aureliella helgolandensis]QDV25702.1 Alpha/beta hydrolase family protein [Aureliella helgolandensis]